LEEAARLAKSRQVADYSGQCLDCVLRVIRQFGREHRRGYKRYLVNGQRETFGLIRVPIRLSMRSGSKNPYAPKKRWE
jgi:predicted GTPase